MYTNKNMKNVSFFQSPTNLYKIYKIWFKFKCESDIIYIFTHTVHIYHVEISFSGTFNMNIDKNKITEHKPGKYN